MAGKRHHPDSDKASLADQVDNAARAADIADPDEGKCLSERLINGIVEGCGVAVLLVMVGLVFWNALSRYIFGATYIWADELVILLVPWLTMFGMFLSVRRREIIRIEYFQDKFSPKQRHWLQVFADLFSVAVFGYLALATFNLIEMFGGDRSVYLKLQKGWFTAALFIGSLLVALAFLADAARTLRDDVRKAPPAD